jgi:hypothetical protein
LSVGAFLVPDVDAVWLLLVIFIKDGELVLFQRRMSLLQELDCPLSGFSNGLCLVEAGRL